MKWVEDSHRHGASKLCQYAIDAERINPAEAQSQVVELGESCQLLQCHDPKLNLLVSCTKAPVLEGKVKVLQSFTSPLFIQILNLSSADSTANCQLCLECSEGWSSEKEAIKFLVQWLHTKGLMPKISQLEMVQFGTTDKVSRNTLRCQTLEVLNAVDRHDQDPQLKERIEGSAKRSKRGSSKAI